MMLKGVAMAKDSTDFFILLSFVKTYKPGWKQMTNDSGGRFRQYSVAHLKRKRPPQKVAATKTKSERLAVGADEFAEDGNVGAIGADAAGVDGKP